MIRLILSLLIICCQTLGMAQTTEQINPQDPNYNVELNSILQTNVSNILLTTNNVSTIKGYFTSSLLNPANGGTGQNSSNWPAGDLIYMSNTGVWGHESSVPWVPTNCQAFTSSGTWTQPANVTKVYVRVWGDGGGGAMTAKAGGGGGGAYNEGVTAVTGNVTVTVGTGGAGATINPSNGVGGGGSSFAGTTTITASGGAGGTGTAISAGGICTNGSFCITGQPGQWLNAAGGYYGGGTYGFSAYYPSTTLGTLGVPLSMQYGYGMGGYGGVAGSANGQNGESGLVIVCY